MRGPKSGNLKLEGCNKNGAKSKSLSLLIKSGFVVSMIPTRAEPFIVRVRAITIITMAIFPPN